jgi:hypothetical protein
MKLYRQQHSKEDADEPKAKRVCEWVPECPPVGSSQRTNPLNLSVHPIPQSRRRVVLLLTHLLDFPIWEVVETWVSFVPDCPTIRRSGLVVTSSEIGQEPFLSSRTRTDHQLWSIVAKISIGPDESTGCDETELPVFVVTLEPSALQRTDIPAVSENVDQVDTGSRLGVEISERQMTHPGAVRQRPGPLSRCDGRTERTNWITSDEIALLKLWPVRVPRSEAGEPQRHCHRVAEDVTARPPGTLRRPREI